MIIVLASDIGRTLLMGAGRHASCLMVSSSVDRSEAALHVSPFCRVCPIVVRGRTSVVCRRKRRISLRKRRCRDCRNEALTCGVVSNPVAIRDDGRRGRPELCGSPDGAPPAHTTVVRSIVNGSAIVSDPTTLRGSRYATRSSCGWPALRMTIRTCTSVEAGSPLYLFGSMPRSRRSIRSKNFRWGWSAGIGWPVVVRLHALLRLLQSCQRAGVSCGGSRNRSYYWALCLGAVLLGIRWAVPGAVRRPGRIGCRENFGSPCWTGGGRQAGRADLA